ncbi:MAG: hypothetical protein MUF01_02595 [Bryobacterales bacterium]|jgi:hypothetical protein|nr:hypothetical protein [Bryobacterales bacterium]
MHHRRLAAFLVGAWLLGSVCMFFVATQNFRGVERLLDMPTSAATQRIDVLGHDEARLLLRYQVSELNRFFFSAWERVQLVLGALLVLVSLRGSQKLYILAIPVVMLLMAAAEHWLLSPEINRLGALMDFVPNARETEEGKVFWRYHQAYSTMEVVKFLLGATFAGYLLTRRRSRSLFRKQVKPQVDVIHNP